MTLLDDMLAAAQAAGEEILRIRTAGFATRQKPDASPVTDADQAAERLILTRLARFAPEIPVVAEESATEGEAPVGERFFLVDPLDGTREFVAGRDEFTVNIALIERSEPVLGVVVAPALGRSFAGDTRSATAFELRRDGHAALQRLPLRVRVAPPGRLVAVASRSHGSPRTESWLAVRGITERVSIGSSLKFCLLAAAEADVYPRFGPTMEWDTAAGQAVLVAAGGRVLDPNGGPLAYGKPGFRNTDFIATAQPLR
ncbi:MAG: 3'(2'),5'-bisphosphate nucleotidase CysQ [Sinobacteraceae bacterium]|nr:3'(2'),5'-bisphosphate nucleotidase CysQ [Nevskiaceae bacterium]MCP5359965.1 3'(2'),5'-bisphosphate nucleotidase CysQ [Nevskiaceae bacterium]MCP5472215.1 3'(2'),5'-bisphosphate nucleotidase CysQ [Nevskiaceae bacterium]